AHCAAAARCAGGGDRRQARGRWAAGSRSDAPARVLDRAWRSGRRAARVDCAARTERIGDESNMPFLTLAKQPARQILDGSIRGHYAHLDQMTIGEVLLDANAIVPMHEHPHEQFTYVIEGRFEFTVGDETQILEPGMVVL